MNYTEDMFTDWYDKDIYPIYNGVYQVDIESRWYSLWRNGNWHFMKISIEEALKSAPKPLYWSAPWRGLKEEYNGQQQANEVNLQTESQ